MEIEAGRISETCGAVGSFRDTMRRLWLSQYWRTEMDIGGVRAVLRREPFHAFTLMLADGRAITIRHPDFVALGQRHVFVVHEDESLSTIEPLRIVAIEEAPPANGRGNGKHRRRKPG